MSMIQTQNQKEDLIANVFKSGTFGFKEELLHSSQNFQD